MRTDQIILPVIMYTTSELKYTAFPMVCCYNERNNNTNFANLFRFSIQTLPDSEFFQECPHQMTSTVSFKASRRYRYCSGELYSCADIRRKQIAGSPQNHTGTSIR